MFALLPFLTLLYINLLFTSIAVSKSISHVQLYTMLYAPLLLSDRFGILTLLKIRYKKNKPIF